MKINCVIKRLKRLFSKHLSRWFKHCYHHYFHYTIFLCTTKVQYFLYYLKLT